MKIARQQRRGMSPPEARLWALLRRSPAGMRFRRQHPIGPFTADFYCPVAKLVIEVDGAGHDNEDRTKRDLRHDAYMKAGGLTVIRVRAAEVMADSVAVADGIVILCSSVAGPSTGHPGSSPG